jgi:hypothetical protein
LAFCHGIIAMFFRMPTVVFCIVSPIETCLWLIVACSLALGTFRGSKVCDCFVM